MGGSKSGQTIDCLEANKLGYNQFNAAYGGLRTKHAIKRAIARGIPIIPSMVWLHDDLFKTQKPKEQSDGLLKGESGLDH